MSTCLNKSKYGSCSKQKKKEYTEFANLVLGCLNYKKQLELDKKTNDYKVVKSSNKPKLRQKASVTVALRKKPRRQAATTETDAEIDSTPSVAGKKKTGKKRPRQQSGKETDETVSTRKSLRQQSSAAVARKKTSRQASEDVATVRKRMFRQKAAGKEPDTGTGGAGAPPKRVELLVEDFVRRVVAKGTICEGTHVHNVCLSAGCSRVSLLEVIDGEAMLPRPSGEFTKVIDAFQSFLEWPNNLIGPTAPSSSTAPVALNDLFVIEPTTRFVAKGIVQEIDGEMVKVFVEEVRDGHALLPKPTEDVNNVGQASGRVVEWYRRLTVECSDGGFDNDNYGFDNDNYGVDNDNSNCQRSESEPENTAAPRRRAGLTRRAAAPRQRAAPRQAAAPVGGLNLRERVRRRNLKKSVTSDTVAVQMAKRDIWVEPEFRRLLVGTALTIALIENLPSNGRFIETRALIQLSKKWMIEKYGIDANEDEFRASAESVIGNFKRSGVVLVFAEDEKCYINSFRRGGESLDFNEKVFELIKLVEKKEKSEASLKNFDEQHNLAE